MKEGEDRRKDAEEGGDWEISVSSPNHLEVGKEWRENYWQHYFLKSYLTLSGAGRCRESSFDTTTSN